jgi:N-methylhydantoinase B
MAGGHAAAANRVSLRKDGVWHDDLPNGKVYGHRMRAGDGFGVHAGGGGGWGAPQLREPQRVADDVRQGYVSVDRARDTYAVALRVDGTVDEVATAQLRAAL